MSLLSRGNLDRAITGNLALKSTFESFLLIGSNPNASIGVEEDIWPVGGIKTWIGTPTTLSIVSDSADDTASAGSGARTVQVIGLGSNLDRISENIALNGTTPVITTLTYKRFASAIVTSSGSSVIPSHVGVITVMAGANIERTMEPISGSSNPGRTIGIFGTTARGFTGLIDQVLATTLTKKELQLSIWVRPVELPSPLTGEPAAIMGSALTSPDGIFSENFPSPLVVPSGFDFWATVTSLGDQNAQVDGLIIGRYVRNA